MKEQKSPSAKSCESLEWDEYHHLYSDEEQDNHLFNDAFHLPSLNLTARDTSTIDTNRVYKLDTVLENIQVNEHDLSVHNSCKPSSTSNQQ